MKPARNIRSVLQEAMALHQQGHAKRAETLYHEVLEIFPDEPNALHLLGVLAWQKGDLGEAETHIRKAIGHNGSVAAWHCNLGGVLKDKRDFAGAIETYRRAVALQPSNAEAKKGLADSHGRQGLECAAAYRWEEAKQAYHHVLELNPDDPGAFNNLAQIFHHAGEQKKALRLYDQALGINPGYAIARFNRGICRLGENFLPEGWQDLAESNADWVPRTDKRKDLPWLKLALWNGENLGGKSVLLWGDQGIGDEILYAGMIPDLIAQGAQITVECAERLVPLFARSFPEITAVPRRTPPLPGTNFDYHAPALWPGRWLRPDFASFPSRYSYLKADPEKTEMLRARYATHGRKKIVGISWHSKTAGQGVNRRMALQDMAAALLRQNTLYVDLQYGDTAAEREAVQRAIPDFFLHHDPEVDQMHDLDIFAAQVAACDSVVTIGNTTAHMAGALGVPGVVFLPTAGLTWYWFQDLAESPWYPSLKLRRKNGEESWKTALAALPVALESAMDIKVKAS